MNILVFIKEVPDDSVAVSVQGDRAAISDITPIVNAFDTYSLEMAVRLKEANEESQVVVVSIGNEEVKNSLKNCLAVGADKAYLVKNDDYRKLDAKAITEILMGAKEKLEAELGAFDVICFGKETTDAEASQVGVYFANKSDLGVVTSVIAMEKDGDKLVTKQEIDGGYRLVETILPSVVTIAKPDYEPRYPTIKSKMAARRQKIDDFEVEATSSPILEEVKDFEPKKREAGVKIQEEEVEDTVAKAISLMLEQKVL
ncbi:MAG: electron transfer flavoprotein subunit beta/FixA family protein [Peptoniphilus harei]|uniref:electron transfer flavoprotein subunit beta/FixA family protein n=1 Tax=Peptoniphilus harei TaxID=54005 RepID=UPI00254A47CC|nr:electron transfer flavoprotein subunit beta/FixA family protein [Peptoniphilus harei]MDK7754469.1 electron transfer flavoprotein subunit beta/FixA family protein [Peptoniphilus harei]MDK7760275.1 electron transfer flavoprotein subunit beta/FixA family protein [Peptoniphilus harei]MDK8270065.1 electron transfer flavoprotein subunit beta/FixA family protein [Peptoniphilus harei]MDK8338524.1 electron transfer flavoprotein subunit beta/FixA family protein [Peptoniphilus harei]MDU7533048.1 elect